MKIKAYSHLKVMKFTAFEAHFVKRLAEGDLLLGKVDVLAASRANSWHVWR